MRDIGYLISGALCGLVLFFVMGVFVHLLEAPPAQAQLPLTNMRVPGTVMLMRPVEINGEHYKAMLVMPIDREEMRRLLTEFEAVVEGK